MTTARLTFPAPRRSTVNCGTRPLPKGKSESTWLDRPWTEEDVTQALLAGAYFVRGRHEFDSDEAAEAAGLGKRRKSQEGSIQKWLKELSPEQLETLRNELTKEQT